MINLCTDQYGNYVIQNLLETRHGENCKEIYEALKGRILEMSIHKFASNVIERCLHYGTKDQKEDIINEIIAPKDENNHDPLVILVKDKFGNYVIQKMIEYAEQEQKEKIIKKIISNDSLKKKDNYAKHVLSYIEKLGYNINNGQKKQNPGNNSNKEENKNNNMNMNNIGSNNNNNFGSNNNMMNDLNNINNMNFANMNMNNYVFNNNDLNLNQINMDDMNNMNFNNFMGNYPDDMNEFQNNQDNNEI